MKKNINIFSMLMLVVYGTLTLAAVPLHHHIIDYVDSPHYQSVISQHGNSCDVCTYASGSFIVSVSSGAFEKLVDNSDETLTLESPKDFSSLSTKEHPRRGPPAFLA